MEYINTLTDKDIFKNPEFEKPDVFEHRTTVKAVVVNAEGKFGFVTNPKHGFYLLPGGGAETNDLNEEIIRECDEEINYVVEVVEEIGRIHEFRNKKAKEYETVCFVVKTVKESPDDNRTEDEKDNGLHVVWLDKEKAIKILNEQVEKVRADQVGFYNTAFNIIRDSEFFSKYLEKLNFRES